MKVELPDIKRCCCCIPLRHGLLVAGYIKLVFALILSGFTILLLVQISNYTARRSFTEDIVIFSIALVMFLIDAPMTCVFLWGGHQKCPRKLRVYYIYGIVCTSIISLLCLALFLNDLYSFSTFYRDYGSSDAHIIAGSGLLLSRFVVGFSYIGFYIYFLLLIRSEIRKLNSNCKFRFTNVAAEEVVCTLDNGISAQRGDHVEQLDQDP